MAEVSNQLDEMKTYDEVRDSINAIKAFVDHRISVQDKRRRTFELVEQQGEMAKHWLVAVKGYINTMERADNAREGS